MLRKIYIVILSGFIAALLFINIVTFFAGLDKGQLVNLLYIPKRMNAAWTLISHIVFESGLIVDDISEEELERTVREVCVNTNVPPELALAVVYADGKIGEFSIYRDGAVGAMHVSNEMLRSAMGLDPFILRDNVQIGVARLSVLIDEGSSMDVVLRKYFAPPKRMKAFVGEQQRVEELAERAWKIVTPPPLGEGGA